MCGLATDPGAGQNPMPAVRHQKLFNQISPAQIYKPISSSLCWSSGNGDFQYDDEGAGAGDEGPGVCTCQCARCDSSEAGKAERTQLGMEDRNSDGTRQSTHTNQVCGIAWFADMDFDRKLAGHKEEKSASQYKPFMPPG